MKAYAALRKGEISMSLGHGLRILEIIITTYCGIKLTVGKEKMRWDSKAARWIFWVLVWMTAAMSVVNSKLTTYSPIEYVVVAICYFILCEIFFRGNIWEFAARNFIFWFHLSYLKGFIVYLCAGIRNTAFIQYVLGRWEDIHWIHAAEMLLVIVVSMMLCWKGKGRSFLKFENKNVYKLLDLVILAELFLFDQIIMPNVRLRYIPGNIDIHVALLGLLLCGSGVYIFIITKSYTDMKYQKQMVQKNYDIVHQQYLLLNDRYEEKRRQMHDSIHQNALLAEYIKSGQYERALEYLSERKAILNKQKVPVYTGDPVMDCMMDYKMHISKGVHWEIDCDICSSPMEQNDTCVLLGNLLDNAIEAVMELEPKMRRIRVSIKSVNGMFLLRVVNPYLGRRRKRNGLYETTKRDKALHGLGLKSVAGIVSLAEGEMRIEDSGNEFAVVITLNSK
mgnify:FL=1